MLDARCDACRGVVAPAPVLSGITDERGHLRVFFHPVFPVFVEVGAEFSRCVVLALILAGPARRCRQHREEIQPRSRREDHQGQQTRHFALPASANSFSRSSPTTTITPPLSSTPIP